MAKFTALALAIFVFLSCFFNVSSNLPGAPRKVACREPAEVLPRVSRFLGNRSPSNLGIGSPQANQRHSHEAIPRAPPPAVQE